MMTRGRITERVGELFQRFIPLGFKLDNLDAPWKYDEEPHVERRQVRRAKVRFALLSRRDLLRPCRRQVIATGVDLKSFWCKYIYIKGVAVKWSPTERVRTR